MKKRLISLSVCTVLTACGGGSGDSSGVDTGKLAPEPGMSTGVYLTTLSDGQDILRTGTAGARFAGVATVLSGSEEGVKTTMLHGNSMEMAALSEAERHNVTFMAVKEEQGGTETSQFLFWGKAPDESDPLALLAKRQVMPKKASLLLTQQWQHELQSLGLRPAGVAWQKKTGDGQLSLLLQAVEMVPAVEFLVGRAGAVWKAPQSRQYPGYYSSYQLNYRGKNADQEDVITLNTHIDGSCHIAANGMHAKNNVWIFEAAPMSGQIAADCRAKLTALWAEKTDSERETLIRHFTENEHAFSLALLANANGEPMLAVNHFIEPYEISVFSDYPVNLSGHGLMSLTK